MWLVLRHSRNIRSRNGRSYHYWFCRCDCGTEREVFGFSIYQQKSTSCGCKTVCRTHGLYRHRIYKIWFNMICRCKYPSTSRYADYGGRGIKVCERWRKFSLFFEDMGMPPSPKHSIDRVNVDGNYEPSNCVWATWTEQMQNQRRTKLNPAKVLEIRSLAPKVGRLELARRYAVCPHMIDHVVKGTAWKNVGGTIRPISPFGRKKKSKCRPVAHAAGLSR